MQFFLPSLITFIIAIVIVFAVLPRLAAPILVGISLVILAFALYHHITLFRTEYALSTWQDQLKFYAPFVMIAALLLAVLAYFGVIAGGGGYSALPVPTLPTLPNLPTPQTATNPLTASINSGLRNFTPAGLMGTPTANNRSVFGIANKAPNRSFFSPV